MMEPQGVSVYPNEFKRPGMLEAQGIEPLPPTEITTKARESLKSWGLSDEEIENLRYFTSQFRYDLCPEKVARLSEKPAGVFRSEGNEYVILPAFFDTVGRHDGQCSDIGGQWIIQMDESGLIKGLNNRLRHPRIVTVKYTGLSETHFNREGANHIWNGLALMDRTTILEEIYVDAAFQNIHHKVETRYRERTAAADIKSLEASADLVFPIGTVTIESNSWQANGYGHAVLGVSFDYNFAYSLAFHRDKNDGVIRPLLFRLHRDGSDDCFLLGRNDQLLTSWGATTSPEHKNEIERILKEAQKINYTEKPPTRNWFKWSRSDT